jgi:hypothetical protein
LKDGNFTVILYQVDRELTEYDSVKRLRMVLGTPPVELWLYPIMAAPENKSYNRQMV